MVDRSRLSVQDLFAEAIAGLLQRPGRATQTMLGTILGVGAFVSILGLTASAASQIDKRFTALAATEVVIDDVGMDQHSREMSFPSDASVRVLRINGVTNAGVFWPLPLRNPTISGLPAADGSTSGIGLYGADPSAVAAMRPTIQSGRIFDAFHQSRGEQVAILGASVAKQLGIRQLDANPAVFIDGAPYSVIGVYSDLQRMPELLSAVVIPSNTALIAYGPPTSKPARMLVETRIGAANQVADQVSTALRPDAPNSFKVTAPPDPRALRNRVTADLGNLFMLLAGLSMIVGGVGIANTTLVAVLERVGEIGLRRAVGAYPRHIAAQFLTESAAIGTLGGLIGTSLGVVTVVCVALLRHWTAVLQPWTVLLAPLVGTAIGLLAGLYPAVVAAKIEPAEALRR